MKYTRFVIYIWAIALLAALAMTLSGCDEVVEPIESEQPNNEEIAPSWALITSDGERISGRARSNCWNVQECSDISPEAFEPDIAVNVGTEESVTFAMSFNVPDKPVSWVEINVYDEEQTLVESLAIDGGQTAPAEFGWITPQRPGGYFVLVNGYWEDKGMWGGEFHIQVEGDQPISEEGPPTQSESLPLPEYKLVDSEGRLVDGLLASYCWPESEGVSICADGLPPVFDLEKVVNLASNQLTVEIHAEVLPDTLNLSLLSPDDQDTLVEVTYQTFENPEQQVVWESEVEPGDYVLVVFGSWQAVGDASTYYSVRIN